MLRLCHVLTNLHISRPEFNGIAVDIGCVTVTCSLEPTIYVLTVWSDLNYVM